MPSKFPNVDQANKYGIIALGGGPDPELLLDAYSNGIFPWPHPEIDELPWFAPPQRAVLLFDNFKGRTRIARYAKKEGFEYYCDTCFHRVIEECASPVNRTIKSSWITDEMIDGYTKLHEMNYAHSIEVFKDNNLVGGIYGVSIRGMFAAESMFFRIPNASKAALLMLIKLLSSQGVTWIDCQQLTSHLSSLGGAEISRGHFMALLKESLKKIKIIFPKGKLKGF